jgi:hypothetical protein
MKSFLIFIAIYSLINSNSAFTQNCFTIGSSENDVRAVQGTPSSVNKTYNGKSLGYEFSTVYFTNGVVSEYSNISNNLKICVSSSHSSNSGVFSIGSSEDEVRAVQGTPTSINKTYNGKSLGYEFSTVYFTNGVVSEYSNISNNLKIGKSSSNSSNLGYVSSNPSPSDKIPSNPRRPNSKSNISVPSYKKSDKQITKRLLNLVLYNNLQYSQKIKDEDIGKFETFDSLLNNHEDALKLYNNLLKDYLFNIEEIGDKESFFSLINQSYNPIKQKSPIPATSLFSSQNMYGELRTFGFNGKFYLIPIFEADEFLKDFPDAKEYKVYCDGNSTYDIPLGEIKGFLKTKPEAKPFYNHGNNSSVLFYTLKDLYLYLSARNSDLKASGFDSFANDMKDENQFKKVFDSLSPKYPRVKALGYSTFKSKMLNPQNQIAISEPPTKTDKTIAKPSFNQIDKISIDNKLVDLPVPQGFIKVNDSMGSLLATAKKMCPITNKLLSYYISEEDYANSLVDPNHLVEKYICVEIFNKFNKVQIGNKDYREFLNSYRNDYLESVCKVDFF